MILLKIRLDLEAKKLFVHTECGDFREYYLPDCTTDQLVEFLAAPCHEVAELCTRYPRPWNTSTSSDKLQQT